MTAPLPVRDLRCTRGGRASVRRRWAAAAVAVVLGVILSGCVGSPSPQPDTTPGTLPYRPSAAAPAGPSEPFATDATLTLGLAGEPTNWNPLAAPAAADPALSVVAAGVLPSAFDRGPGGAPVLDTDLVTSATVTTADPQTVTYEINGRARWSDGVAVTGADFVYTWRAQSGQRRFTDRGGRPFSPASTAGYRQVSSVTSAATDPQEVVVRFSTPDPDWRSLFAPILPAHVGAAVGFDHGFTDPVTALVSAGPFLVQSYQPGRDVTLVRNPSWWGTAANLAAVDVTFVDSSGEAAEGLEQGQLDAAATTFSAAAVAALRATVGLTVAVVSGPRYDDLVFDERSGPLSIRAVRLALMIAVDRRGLVRQAVTAGDTGAATVDNRVYAPGTSGYRDGATVLAAGGRASPVARADALLTLAGFDHRGGSLVRDGVDVRVSLAVASSSPLAGDEAGSIVAAGRSLGIAVHVTGSPSDPATARQQRHAGMALVQTTLSTGSAALDSAYGGGGASLSDYSSLVMDGLLTRLVTVVAPTEHDEILDQIDAQAWDDAVDLPLLGVPSIFAYQTRYVDLTGTSAVPGLASDTARWGIPQST